MFKMIFPKIFDYIVWYYKNKKNITIQILNRFAMKHLSNFKEENDSLLFDKFFEEH